MSDLMLTVPDPNSADPQALADRRRQKSRRRAALWGAFLLLGLALGTIYATGFAEIGGEAGTTGSAGAPGLSPTPADTNAYTPLITQPTGGNGEIAWNWSGRWGSVSSETLYQIDLTGQSGTFYSSVYLTEEPAAGTFSDLRLQFRITQQAGDCTAGGAELNPATTTKVMYFNTNDAQVTFPGLATGAGAKYCLGVFNYAGPPESGKDLAGTFIRRPAAGAAPPDADLPKFVVTLNKQ